MALVQDILVIRGIAVTFESSYLSRNFYSRKQTLFHLSPALVLTISPITLTIASTDSEYSALLVLLSLLFPSSLCMGYSSIYCICFVLIALLVLSFSSGLDFLRFDFRGLQFASPESYNDFFVIYIPSENSGWRDMFLQLVLLMSISVF